MRIQTRSIPVAIVMLSLLCGFIGCKSNKGPWYKPTTYSFHNPFKSMDGDEDYSTQFADDSAINPISGQTPDLSPPIGGYNDMNKTRTTSAALAGTGSGVSGQQYGAMGGSSPPIQQTSGMQSTYDPNVGYPQPKATPYPNGQYASQYQATGQGYYPENNAGAYVEPNQPPYQPNSGYPQPAAQPNFQSQQTYQQNPSVSSNVGNYDAIGYGQPTSTSQEYRPVGY